MLQELVQGYDRSRESAHAALAWLDKHFEVNPAMKAAISALIEDRD